MAYKLFFLTIGLLCSLAFAGTSSHRQGGTSIYFTQLGHLKHQADLGDPNAQFLLGNLYLSPPPDTAIQQNLDKAVDYYFKAAIRDHAGAQYNLGVLYYRGSGLEESKMMASVWFTIAAQNTSPVAKNVIRNAQQSLKELQDSLTSDDKIQADQWVTEYQNLIKSKSYRLAKLPKL